MCFSLFPHSSVLFGKDGTGKDYMYPMEGEVVRLGKVLEFFYVGGGVRGVGAELFLDLG